MNKRELRKLLTIIAITVLVRWALWVGDDTVAYLTSALIVVLGIEAMK